VQSTKKKKTKNNSENTIFSQKTSCFHGMRRKKGGIFSTFFNAVFIIPWKEKKVKNEMAIFENIFSYGMGNFAQNIQFESNE